VSPYPSHRLNACKALIALSAIPNSPLPERPESCLLEHHAHLRRRRIDLRVAAGTVDCREFDDTSTLPQRVLLSLIATAALADDDDPPPDYSLSTIELIMAKEKFSTFAKNPEWRVARAESERRAWGR
jgi:hypothetical protein